MKRRLKKQLEQDVKFEVRTFNTCDLVACFTNKDSAQKFVDDYLKRQGGVLFIEEVR